MNKFISRTILAVIGSFLLVVAVRVLPLNWSVNTAKAATETTATNADKAAAVKAEVSRIPAIEIAPAKEIPVSVESQPLTPDPKTIEPPKTEIKTTKTKPVKVAAPDQSNVFFDQGMIPTIKIDVANPEMDKLRQQPREYVRATMTEDGKTTYKSIGVKLKGAAGSFRGVDDRPALTLNTDKYEKNQKFHDLEKFHLNNSVQDDGAYFHELVSSYIFNRAKVPAARATHARVFLNNRDLGLYVLKEGFDKHFIHRYYDKADGNLYDGGFCIDIDSPLEKDSGSGVDDRSDLKALIDACREGDLTKRKARLQEVLDVDAFLRFYCCELMTCHWDGYARNRNNYRVFFDSTNKKGYFFPHGMDQMFGNPGEGIFDVYGSIVVQGVFQVPEYQDRYNVIVRELAPILTEPTEVFKVVDKAHERLKPVLTAMDPNRATQNQQRAEDLKRRMTERGKILLQHIAARPEPMKWENGVAGIPNDWLPKAEGDAVLKEENFDGRLSYSIATGPSGRCISSYRRKAQLLKGKYKLQANVRTQDVVELAEPPKVGGAGMRFGGGVRENKVAGTTGWQTIEFPFEITEDRRDAELVLELRATKGQVWFEKNSLRFVKVN